MYIQSNMFIGQKVNNPSLTYLHWTGVKNEIVTVGHFLLNAHNLKNLNSCLPKRQQSVARYIFENGGSFFNYNYISQFKNDVSESNSEKITFTAHR